MPGNVQVDYWFGDDAPSFVAWLGMTPIGPCKTQVLVTIGTRLGKWNWPIGVALPTLIRKVLKQDQQIMAEQKANLDLVHQTPSPRRSLQFDAVDSTVRAMRNHFRDPALPKPKEGVRKITVQL